MTQRLSTMLTLAVMTLASGCGSSASPQEKLQSTLVACGVFLDDGRHPNYFARTSPREQNCLLGCIDSATCTQISNWYCDGFGPVDTCVDDCFFDGTCPDGTWVGFAGWCDGVVDCADGRDEEHCPFVCPSGAEIPASWVCDGDNDCGDMSDELNCESTQFRCANGLTIPLRWECDGDNDCGDSSDELGCATLVCM